MTPVRKRARGVRLRGVEALGGGPPWRFHHPRPKNRIDQKMYRTIKSTKKPTTSPGQSDTCENGSQVKSERQARDLQGLWNSSSREARLHLKANASGLDVSSNKALESNGTEKFKGEKEKEKVSTKDSKLPFSLSFG
ncbi:hypothetical protein YC2023_095024 [Brassica napus]